MVKVLNRLIQEINPAKWQELNALDKKFNEIESAMGYPEKKRFRALVSPEHNDTLIIERIWSSIGKMEELMEKAFFSPEYAALMEESQSIVKSQRMELYWVL